MSWAWPFGIFHSSFRPNTFSPEVVSWVLGSIAVITEVTVGAMLDLEVAQGRALVEDLQRVPILLPSSGPSRPKVIEHCWTPCCYTFLWKKKPDKISLGEGKRCTGIPCFTATLQVTAFFFFYFYKWKVCGKPSVTFAIVFVHFMSLSHFGNSHVSNFSITVMCDQWSLMLLLVNLMKVWVMVSIF